MNRNVIHILDNTGKKTTIENSEEGEKRGEGLGTNVTKKKVKLFMYIL